MTRHAHRVGRLARWLLVWACLPACAARSLAAQPGPHLGYSPPEQPADPTMVNVWVPAAVEQVVNAWLSTAPPEAAGQAQPWLAWLQTDEPMEPWPDTWSGREVALLGEVNRRRASGAWCGDRWRPPAPPLHGQPRLRKAARHHSRDMVSRGFFGHISPNGHGPAERVLDAGWPARGYLGELVASGGGSAFHTVAMWMGSANHCRSLMHARFRHAGFGHFGARLEESMGASTALISE